MDAKGEKRAILKKEAVLFIAALCTYILVYIVLYLCLALINAVAEIHPYIMLAGMVCMLYFAALITRRLLKTDMMRAWLD